MATVLLTDQEIENEIRSQMQWDSRLAHERVLVSVTDGKATLSGTVPTYTDSLLAAQNAQLVYGVTDVENKLIVSLPHGTRMPTDAELQANIKSIFSWSSHLSNDDIDVIVSKGYVVLSGHVGAFWKRSRAEELASEIQGVIDITNELTIVRTDQPADEATAADIMQALARDARVDVNDINVTVRDGHVKLLGSVDDMDAYRAVDRIARYTFGVVDVDNFLTIQLREKYTAR